MEVSAVVDKCAPYDGVVSWPWFILIVGCVPNFMPGAIVIVGKFDAERMYTCEAIFHAQAGVYA